MKCPYCGAETSEDKCPYCGSEMPKEKPTVNITNNYYGKMPEDNNTPTNNANDHKDQGKKKRKTWLWVLGWICIFPVPLTILMLRKKDMKPSLKYGIIAIAWIIYLLIGLGGDQSNKNSTNVEAQQVNESETNAGAEEIQEETETETETEAETEAETESLPKDTDVVKIDENEWPTLSKLGLNKKTMIDIYHDYKDAMKESYDDPEQEKQYEQELSEKIGEKYGITSEEATQVYGFAVMHYEDIVGTGGQDMKIPNGEVLSTTISGSTIVIKAKIKSSLTNEYTISQNYYNVCDLIRNYNLNEYDELGYWAVADMTDGSEQKVVSFTVYKDIMDIIASTDFPDNTLGKYVSDLWVHPSLMN